MEIEVKGTSAHASVPWQGTNAMYRLNQVLRRIEDYEPERDTSTSLFDYLSNFAIEHKPSAANVDEIISEIEPDNPRFASMMRALSRMTLTPTMIRGGIKSNSVPETINLTCDVRTLPHQTEDYLREQLDEILKGIPGVSYEIDYMAVPNSSDFESRLTDSIKKATAKAQEDVDLIAELNKAMENLGTNGKKPAAGGGAKSEPTTRAEVEEALRTGPTKDYDKNMAKLAALDE